MDRAEDHDEERHDIDQQYPEQYASMALLKGASVQTVSAATVAHPRLTHSIGNPGLAMIARNQLRAQGGSRVVQHNRQLSTADGQHLFDGFCLLLPGRFLLVH